MKRLIVVALLLICVACGKDNTEPDAKTEPQFPPTHVKIITEFNEAADGVSYAEVEINGRRCIEAFYDTPAISCDPATTTTTTLYR